jgi:RNA polymerase sigma factor (sigma-70 family)
VKFAPKTGAGRALPLMSAVTPAHEAASITDDVLLARCATGHGAALGELFDRHNVLIYRFLTRMLGAGHPDLDELVNETFLNVHRSAAKFRGHSSVKTWITAIAANVARHHIRGESRRRAFLRVFQIQRQDDSLDATHVSEQRDLVRRLGRLVAALPADLRVVFVMCDLEEIPGAEAARALSVPEGTLWRRLHEARKALRSSLGEAGQA